MQLLRLVGWIFVPFIMVFVRWKHLRADRSRAWAVVWCVVLVAFAWRELQTATALNSTPPATAPLIISGNVGSKPNAKTDNSASQTSSSSATQPSEKDQFEAELQKIKDHKLTLNARDQLQFEKQYIKFDKPGLLAMEPSVLDAGFAGDLFVQTDRDTTKEYQSIGTGISVQSANGVYWVVQVTVVNAGMNPLTVGSNMFTLVTTDGRKYAPDVTAEADLVNQKAYIMENVNPLMDVTGYLVFDMPTNVKASDVTLHIQSAADHADLKIS